jgi:acyl-CoA thioester hydrolase
VLVDIAADKIDNRPAFGLQSIVQYIERVLRTTQASRQLGEEQFHALQSSTSQTYGRRMLISRVMFEVKIRTHWHDVDPAGIVFFASLFTFVEQAEEELFRARTANRMQLLQQHKVWMPRVEAFSKHVRPIKIGAMIRVRVTPHFKGLKTIRYDFEILDDASSEKLAEGYVTVVCVDADHFKATPIPDPIRSLIDDK